jgi:hypothetical protein
MKCRVGRVEDGRGSLGPVGIAPFPIPAHRTGRARLRHPALRLASPRDARGVNQPHAESARWVTLLRPSTQQPRTAPVIDSVLRLIANQHDLAIFESTPEVRALRSAGITRHQRSYDPVRLPPRPPPVATLRPLPSPVTGLPRLPEPPFRRAVPTTPADRAGARVDYFPARAAFPKWREGRHPHCHFRGLSFPKIISGRNGGAARTRSGCQQ